MNATSSLHRLQRIGRRALVFASMLLSVSIATYVEAQDMAPRVWRDVTGQFSVEATLVKRTKNSVVLLTSDGRRINVAVAKLCAADRDFLEAQSSDATPNADPSTTDVAITDTLAGPPMDPATVALSELADLLAIPTFIDVRGLEDDGMLVTTPVELGPGHQNLEEQLDEALGNSQLGWYRTQTVLVFSAEKAVSRVLETRLYKINTPGRQFDRVIQRFQQTSPSSWEVQGGRGAIAPIGSVYAVAQSPSVHRQLAADLRTAPLPHRYAHPLDKVAVSVSVAKGSLNEVLDAIGSQVGLTVDVRVDYDRGSSEGDFSAKRWDLELQGVSPKDVLDLVLGQLEYTWRDDAGKLIIESEDAAEVSPVIKRFMIRTGPMLDPNRVLAALQTCVASSEWEALGGEGTMNVVRSGLYEVQQSPPSMREVEQFVSDLNAVR